jgi:type 1 glutamine amidotransferase
MAAGATGQDSPRWRALLIDGQNNHGNWPETSAMMRSYLEETGLFAVDGARTAKEGTDPTFNPQFSDYQVVVSNYNGAAWPEATQRAFAEYVQAGGGFVVIHAADNAFSEWPEYNRMIGLGGWGGRNEHSGPLVYFDANGKIVRDASAGAGGHHGQQHDFAITIRDAEHPITKGMPGQWLHVNDELYDSLRGPAQEMGVLATAYSDPATGGTGRHEPMILVVQYGKGRIFHTPMGHGNDSQKCVGFIATFQRGAEWAASGQVTQTIPDDFPTESRRESRPFQPEGD